MSAGPTEPMITAVRLGTTIPIAIPIPASSGASEAGELEGSRARASTSIDAAVSARPPASARGGAIRWPSRAPTGETTSGMIVQGSVHTPAMSGFSWRTVDRY